MLALYDAWTNNFANPGLRESSAQGETLVLVGPGTSDEAIARALAWAQAREDQRDDERDDASAEPSPNTRTVAVSGGDPATPDNALSA